MDAELTVPVNAVDFIETLEKRILHELWDSVLVWSESVRALAQWEDEHLLDSPSAEMLEKHRSIVERQIALGKFISLATEHPDFPDKETRQHVAATMAILRDKIPIWHSTMSAQEADRILAEVFPEPELERLLHALYERDTCEPQHQPQWEATLERLIADALARRPGTSRTQFLEAVHLRYQEFKRTRRKRPSAMPPRA